METVYKQDPSYSDKASSLFVLDLGPPEKLPDVLRGERWSFVQLPLSALQEELELVDEASALVLYSYCFACCHYPLSCLHSCHST